MHLISDKYRVIPGTPTQTLTLNPSLRSAAPPLTVVPPPFLFVAGPRHRRRPPPLLLASPPPTPAPRVPHSYPGWPVVKGRTTQASRSPEPSMEAARWCHSEQHHAATSCCCGRQIRGRGRWIRAATGQGLIGRAAAARGRFTTRTCRCSFSNPAAGRDPVAPGLLLVAAGGRRPRPQNHGGARPRPLARGAPPRTPTTRTRRRTTWQRQFYSGTHGSTAKAMLLSPSPL